MNKNTSKIFINQDERLWYEKRKAIEVRIKSEFPTLFESVSRCIFNHDPMHINVHDNYDEYDPEAACIIERLPSCSSADDLKIVFESVFEDMFSIDLSDKYLGRDDIVYDIWRVFSEVGFR